jgi:hypothetical protein
MEILEKKLRLKDGLPIHIKLEEFRYRDRVDVEIGEFIAVNDFYEIFFVKIEEMITNDLYVGVIQNNILSYLLDSQPLPYTIYDKIIIENKNIIV